MTEDKADRPAFEIEITDQMVEAGVAALEASQEIVSAWTVVRDVYTAMARAERGCEPVTF